VQWNERIGWRLKLRDLHILIEVTQSVPRCRRPAPSPQVRFAQDSPLEGDGFEPSVPGDKPKPVTAPSFVVSPASDPASSWRWQLRRGGTRV
jgi:hypothetical protein